LVSLGRLLVGWGWSLGLGWILSEGREAFCLSYKRGHNADVSLTNRFSKDRPRFTDTLDVIKFLCKDLWQIVFRKQIDNLKTNHRVRPPFLHASFSGISES